jgi:hypothetical protein
LCAEEEFEIPTMMMLMMMMMTEYSEMLYDVDSSVVTDVSAKLTDSIFRRPRCPKGREKLSS